MVWATSVNMPAGATVGGKTEAQIGADVQAALNAGDKSKLESIMDSLHNAGYSGSFNASKPFLDVVGRSEYTGIVPASVASSSAATAAYVEENQMGPTTSSTSALAKSSNTATRWIDDAGNQERVRLAEARSGGSPGDEGYLRYIQTNPGLREGVEALGFTRQETIDWAKWHWSSHGESEYAGGTGGRLNTPWTINLPQEEFAQPNPTDIAGFQAFIQGAGDHPLSEMWQARKDIGAAAGTPWDVGQFTAQGWNFDPDAPYMRGLLGDTIGVEAGVGQLTDAANKRFLQDRYVDAAIANDFPVNWVGAEGEWKGPSELAGYWSQMTNAIRNAAGELEAITDRPDTGWAGSDVLPVGPRWSGDVRPDGTTLADQGGLGSAYRPWTQSYWDKYLGPDIKKSLFSMKAPPVEQSLAYLPGEFRNPAGWRAVLDAPGDLMENIPAGAWRRGTMGPTGLNAPGWPALGQGNPWQFTSPASATNIAYTPGFTGADISPAAAADWHGLLSNLGDTPRIDASPTSLLGGSDTAGVPYTTRTIIN
jgi:hypothetical protein